MAFCKRAAAKNILVLFFIIFSYPAFSQTEGVTMLNTTQKNIIPIVALTAIGDITNLKTALNEALDEGVTVNEVKEALVQTYAYAGFPRSLNGLTALMQVLETRQAAGKSGTQGRDASPIVPNVSMLELGTEIQTKVVGQPVSGPLYTFAPIIDQFLKSHLFGDIFARDVLDYQTREVATIAILATLPGLESQLQSHYGIGLNTGLSRDQLRQIVSILNEKLGADVGTRAETVLNQL